MDAVNFQTQLQQVYGDAVPDSVKKLLTHESPTDEEKRQAVEVLRQELKNVNRHRCEQSQRLRKLTGVFQRYETTSKDIHRQFAAFADTEFPLPMFADRLKNFAQKIVRIAAKNQAWLEQLRQEVAAAQIRERSLKVLIDLADTTSSRRER